MKRREFIKKAGIATCVAVPPVAHVAIKNATWTHDWNKDAKLGYARVIDATGQRYGSVSRCNVRTGAIEICTHDPEGDFIDVPIQAKAPLKVEFLDA